MEASTTQCPFNPTAARSVYTGLFADLSAIFSDLNEDLERDFDWIMEKLNTASFVSDLAALGKAFDLTLITGVPLSWDTSVFPVEYGGLPSFLHRLFHMVLHLDGTPIFGFDAKEGVYRDADGYLFPFPRSVGRELADAIVAIRQVCLLYSKADDLPVLAKIEDEINSFKIRITAKPRVTPPRGVVHLARRILRDILMPDGDLHPSFQQWELEPFGLHGPGAVFDGSKGRDKWNFDYLSGSHRRILLGNDNVTEICDVLPQEITPVSRLAVVPKDFRGHRLICIECKESMFAQQGLWRVLESIIDSNSISRQSINFRDQRQSFIMSKEDGFSTIDLKDASDRVSLTLGKLILPREVFKLLTKYRSRSVYITENDEWIDNYETLFTMGNALCFPVETLVFFALGIATLSYYGGFSLQDAASHLRVFGDDIIIDSRYAEQMNSVLVSCGLAVNLSKFCHDTPVRESCGSWFYAKVDCRIQRMRKTCPRTMQDWIAWFQTARQLHASGLTETALAILHTIEDIYSIPYGFFDLPGQKSVKGKAFRYNSALQRLEFCMPVLKQTDQFLHLEGRVGLYSNFTGRGGRTVGHSDALSVEWSWEGV